MLKSLPCQAPHLWHVVNHFWRISLTKSSEIGRSKLAKQNPPETPTSLIFVILAVSSHCRWHENWIYIPKGGGRCNPLHILSLYVTKALMSPKWCICSGLNSYSMNGCFQIVSPAWKLLVDGWNDLYACHPRKTSSLPLKNGTVGRRL